VCFYGGVAAPFFAAHVDRSDWKCNLNLKNQSDLNVSPDLCVYGHTVDLTVLTVLTFACVSMISGAAATGQRVTAVAVKCVLRTSKGLHRLGSDPGSTSSGNSLALASGHSSLENIGALQRSCDQSKTSFYSSEANRMQQNAGIGHTIGAWLSSVCQCAPLFGICSSEAGRLRGDFIREIRAVARMRHPNIISLMGAAVGDGGEPLLVMELMGYGSLWDLLRNQSVRLDGDIVLQMLQVDSPLYPILSG
jgi:hypothetical protein